MSIVLDTKDFKEGAKAEQGQLGSYGEVASTVLGSGSSNNTGSSNNVGSIGNVGSTGSVGSNPNVGESNNLVSSGAVGSSAVNIETAEKPVVYKQYAYRFVIMFVYFAISNAGAITGTTCAPIITNLTEMYGISQVQVNLANLLGMIVYIPATIPGNYILDTWGIRIGMWIGTLLLVAGAWLRMLATTNFTWVILGNLLAALGGPLIANCPQKISAYWNGPKQRTMFTTLLVLSGALGGSIGILIPGYYIGEESSPEVGKPLFMKLMLIEAIVASAMCIPMLLFREKPPTPPSASAAAPREDFRQGLKTIFKNRSFLWLLAQQGCVLGALNALSIVMQSVVDPFGITQAQAATLAVILTVSCVTGCLIIGIFVEKTKKFKLATVMSSIVGLAGFGLFLGVLYAESFIGVAIALAFLGFTISPSGPLCLEFACELTFPVGEATSGGVILCVIQIFCPAMSFSISAIMEGENKRNATLYSMIMLMAFMVLGALFSLKIKEDLVRSRVDNKHNAKKVEEPQTAGNNNPETPCPMLDKPDPSPTPKDEIKS